MSQLFDSVLLITSQDEHNTNVGTGFVFWRDSHQAYILTCAHVVEDVGGVANLRLEQISKNQVEHNQKLTAEAVALGARDGVDLAVLRVSGLDMPALPLFTLTEPGGRCAIHGCKEASYPTFVAESLQARIAKLNRVIVSGKAVSTTWLLYLDANDALVGGYSGSPVSLENGQVFAIASNASLDSQQGYAISIENLTNIWADMPADLLTSESKVDANIKPHLSGVAPGDYYKCNRRDQDICFREHFNQYKQGKQPLFYVLHGDKEASHQGFIQRLCDEYIQPHADQVFGVDQADVFMLTGVAWSRREGESAMRDINQNLSRALEADRGKGFDGADLSDNLSYFLQQYPHRAVVIAHNLYAVDKDWHQQSLDVLQRYAQQYQSVYQQVTQQSIAIAQCLVFVNVIYPDQAELQRASWWQRGRYRLKRVESQLCDQQRLADWQVIDKLGQVHVSDVNPVLQRFSFLSHQQRREQENSLFEKGNEQDMSRVEDLLEALFHQQERSQPL